MKCLRNDFIRKYVLTTFPRKKILSLATLLKIQCAQIICIGSARGAEDEPGTQGHHEDAGVWRRRYQDHKGNSSQTETQLNSGFSPSSDSIL